MRFLALARSFCITQRWLIAAMLLVMPSIAYADAAMDFARGDFLASAQSARAENTAAGEALAARATLVYAELLAPREERASLVAQAETDARRAISLDADNPEGHLYLAIALGFRGRLEGRMAAHFLGLGKEAREHIAIAQKLAPQSAWVHAVLGGWNLEICLRGGMLGRSIYHASTSRGIAEYEQALTLDPSNPSIIFQYAVQLLALNGDGANAKVIDLLKRTQLSPPQNALERLGQARAKHLLALVESKDEAPLRDFLSAQFDLSSAPVALTQD